VRSRMAYSATHGSVRGARICISVRKQGDGCRVGRVHERTVATDTREDVDFPIIDIDVPYIYATGIGTGRACGPHASADTSLKRTTRSD